MPILGNPRHERFAQAVAKGASAGNAYASAGYSRAGADASASRLLRIAKVRARVEELKTSICEGVVTLEITERSARLQALQDIFDRMQLLKDARATDMVADPGGPSGLICRDYKGKDADQVVFKFDAAFVAEFREVLKHVAIEKGQWIEKQKVSGDINITLVERINAGRKRLQEVKSA